MNCSKCGQDNKPNALYCEKCGAELEVRSPRPVLLTEDGTKPVFVPLAFSDTQSAAEQPYVSVNRDPSPKNLRMDELRPLPVSRTSKSHKKLWIVLTVIVIVLALVGGLGFAFRMDIIRTIAPEKYLQLSLVRTLTGSKNEASQILDLSKYSGKAVSHEFSVDADLGSAEGTLMYDSESEQALLDISASAEGNEYNDNQLYISPDLIAFSIPDVITDTDYLTIDPATFAADSKEMGWDEYTSSLDLEEFIQTLFGKSEAKDKDSQLTSEITDLCITLRKSAVFSADGSVEEEISGKKITLDEMTYTISQKDINYFYQDCLAIYKKEFINTMDQSVAGGLPQETREQFDEVFDGLISIKIRDDLVIHYYIDKDGYTRKISTEDFEIYNDSADADVQDTATLGFAIVFGSGTRPADSIDVTLRLDSQDESFAADIKYETSYINDVYKNSTSIVCSDNSDEPSKISMSADTEWDTKDTNGDNFSIDLKIKDDTGTIGAVVITGALTDDEKETSLSDASIEITDADGTSTTIDFSYKITIIDPSEISIDTSDSTSLFEYEPFTADLADSI